MFENLDVRDGFIDKVEAYFETEQDALDYIETDVKDDESVTDWRVLFYNVAPTYGAWHTVTEKYPSDTFRV